MKKKLRLAIVVSHPIQHFCPQYVSFAQNKQCSTRVFFGSALGYKKYTDENFKQEIAWGNLALEKFDHVFLNSDAVLPANAQLDAANLDTELEQYQPGLVIVYGYFQLLQRRAHRWAIRHDIPIAYISDSELRHHRNALKEFLKGFFLRRYFSRISYFLSVGNANEAFYKKYGVPPEKLVRMHFSIDVQQYQQSYADKSTLRHQIRQQYGIGADEIVISVAGKLSPWKNQDLLISVTRLLESKGIYLHLFILGSGEMKSAWEQQSGGLQHSKIYFPGFVNIELLPAYYAATDIYVHPASMEPHSIAVSEAIYMGCPVIVSDRSGSYGETDDVQEGKNGYVVESGNKEQLAEKITLLINDRNKRAAFGHYSHAIAVEFQQQAHYGVLEDLINRL